MFQKTRQLLFTVSIKDCRVDTFSVGGNGGSGKDTSNTGVRVVHLPSGAMGRAVDSRSQGKNKELAFRRMAETKEFRGWARLEASKRFGEKSIEEQVEESLSPENLKVEVRGEDGKWSLEDDSET